MKPAFQTGDVLLFTDWTLLRLFPPLRAMWAAIGTQAKVAITGQNAKRALFGTINVRTAHRTVTIGRSVGTHDVQAFLLALRKAYRRAGTIWPNFRTLDFRTLGNPQKSLALTGLERIVVLNFSGGVNRKSLALIGAIRFYDPIRVARFEAWCHLRVHGTRSFSGISTLKLKHHRVSNCGA